MNQLDNQIDISNEDFKIYDEFCENLRLDSRDQNQNNLSQERIYQNLIEIIETNEVFENMSYARDGYGQEENEYEIVNVQRNKLGRKLRSLKTLRN